MNILFPLVSYNNVEEVNSFIKKLRCLSRKTLIKVDIVIVDNFGNYREACKNKIRSDVLLLEPETNLGYLGASVFAIDHYLIKNELPDWLAVTNTDMSLPENFFELFDNVPEGVGQLSPMICAEGGRVQNPYILKRPSQRFFKMRKMIHALSVVGGLYILVAMLKNNFCCKNKRDIERKNCNSDECNQKLYAAHGSMFFLNKYFFKKGGSLNDAPFLYGEELFVAEELYRLVLDSLCKTTVSITHLEHSTSKYLMLKQKSKMMKVSYKLLYEKYLENNL